MLFSLGISIAWTLFLYLQSAQNLGLLDGVFGQSRQFDDALAQASQQVLSVVKGPPKQLIWEQTNDITEEHTVNLLISL